MFLLFLVMLAIAGSVIVLSEWIPESTFELASESRLPKWITLPPGLTRADVSTTMSYYICRGVVVRHSHYETRKGKY